MERKRIHYRWMDPEAEGVGDLKFTCDCGLEVTRDSAYIGDDVVCECGIHWRLVITAYMQSRVVKKK